jgi:hypothetical protein
VTVIARTADGSQGERGVFMPGPLNFRAKQSSLSWKTKDKRHNRTGISTELGFAVNAPVCHFGPGRNDWRCGVLTYKAPGRDYAQIAGRSELQASSDLPHRDGEQNLQTLQLLASSYDQILYEMPIHLHLNPPPSSTLQRRGMAEKAAA